MKAWKTVVIGVGVTILSGIQLAATGNLVRLVGLGIGLFCIVWGWKIGWIEYKGLTTLLGHLVVTAGCLVSAWAVYQLPSMTQAPTLLETLDLPLFWGVFAIFGGYCMITHGYCTCAQKEHRKNNPLAPKQP